MFSKIFLFLLFGLSSSTKKCSLLVKLEFLSFKCCEKLSGGMEMQVRRTEILFGADHLKKNSIVSHDIFRAMNYDFDKNYKIDGPESPSTDPDFNIPNYPYSFLVHMREHETDQELLIRSGYFQQIYGKDKSDLIVFYNKLNSYAREPSFVMQFTEVDCNYVQMPVFDKQDVWMEIDGTMAPGKKIELHISYSSKYLEAPVYDHVAQITF